MTHLACPLMALVLGGYDDVVDGDDDDDADVGVDVGDADVDDGDFDDDDDDDDDGGAADHDDDDDVVDDGDDAAPVALPYECCSRDATVMTATATTATDMCLSCFR